MLIKSVSSTKFHLFVLHFSNAAQFLNTACVIAPSSISVVSAAFLLLTLIFPVAKIYVSQ